MIIYLAHIAQNCRITYFIIQLFLVSCGIPDQLEVPDDVCADSMETNMSINEIKEIASGSPFKISEEWVITGYVISSDHSGNFFNSLHIQDKIGAGASGMKIEFELRDSYLRFPIGSKVYIKLKGLYAGVSNGILKIGSAMTNFGSLAISRIPSLKIDEHIKMICDSDSHGQIPFTTIDSLQFEDIGTLIALDQVEFQDDMLGRTFAVSQEETMRYLSDCRGFSITLLNSGYSSFQADFLPEGNGTLKGILLKKGKNFLIKIRDTGDLLFENKRCSELFPLSTSEHVFFSEIADPENNSKARFIELYNSSDVEVSLKGWSVKRYTNDNSISNSTFDLTGSTIGPRETLVIASNDSVFQSVYNLLPDLIGGTNSVADSNGDDNLVLLNPFESVVDQFGIPGEDGSNTNHEFEDGGAFRKSTIDKGNPNYLFDEWVIYNDTGGEGTILEVLHAPEDFSPGRR